MPSRPHPTTDTPRARVETVTVESLGGLGDGIAQLGGKAVFIPKSAIGDTLSVRIVHENRDGLQGQIEDIITPGPHRIIPPCGYYKNCGGCALQHFDADYYRSFKTRITQNAFTHAGFAEHTPNMHFLPFASRRRAEFKIAHKNDAGRAQPVLAFHEARSHTPVPIDTCLILRPELQAMIAPLNQMLTVWPFTPELYAISLTLADSGIDLLLTFRHAIPARMPDLKEDAQALGIARISLRIRENEKKTAPKTAIELTPVHMLLGGYAIPLPADAFLQAAAEGQALLTQAAFAACESSKTVADLFCGIGTYSFAASHKAEVLAIEGDGDMMAAMRSSAKAHHIASLNAQQRDLFKNPLTPAELSRFDAVIVNPPRLGAKAQCEALAQSQVGRVAMISCNPATFARDAKILKNAGFGLISGFGVDQFVFSPHLEVVAVFSR